MKSINDYIEDPKSKEELIEQLSSIIEHYLEDPENNTINEGIIASIVGGLAGVTLGSTIMKAICKVLKIESGPLYNLLTSKLVCGAAGAVLANRK
jgi:hypothetical protein